MTGPALQPLAPQAGTPDDVGLVRVALDDGVTLDDPLFAVLSAEERTLASGFRQAADGLRSAATRAGLRHLLGGELGVAPESLAFARSERGRPALATPGRPPLDFNVSHSGDHALIAWSRRRRVGVDVEMLRPAWDWRPLARLVLGPADAARIDATPDAARRQALFYAVWTAKEALLKAEGRGVTAELGAFSVLCEDPARPRVAGAAALLAGYEAVWLPDLAGHAACLAWGPAWRR